MIPYHGTPVGGEKTNAVKILRGRHVLVSHEYPGDLPNICGVCESFVLDNGAFTAWTAKRPITDWSKYYAWVGQWRLHPFFEWALIPDVIDGTEEDNDRLISEWPFKFIGVPVWHYHESTARLESLMEAFPCVALGSSKEFSQIGTEEWWQRTDEIMRVACDSEGRPQTKLHGLRMLDEAVTKHVPLHSADSTNVARNCCFNRPYHPANPAVRGELIASRIENQEVSEYWVRRPRYVEMFQ